MWSAKTTIQDVGKVTVGWLFLNEFSTTQFYFVLAL